MGTKQLDAWLPLTPACPMLLSAHVELLPKLFL
jgi:hypothetical protein